MVDISTETPEQTEARLRRVVAAAQYEELPGLWTFHESPLADPPAVDPAVLAIVRDEDTWSALRPATATAADTELFGVCSFHFPPGLDNSGFVGWLATLLKRELGSGVFVVCGSNSRRGGIHDYWGYPAALRAEVAGLIGRLRSAENRSL